METNRDKMHAAGGAFFAGQNAREAASEPGATADNGQQTKREPRKVLDMREERAVANWLHDREPQWGETAADIFEQARKALPQVTILNVDHIKTRLREFADTLPKATPPVRELTVIERLERVEKGLSIFAKWVTGDSQMGAPDRAWLADYLSETGL